jgi:hypothetical protein
MEMSLGLLADYSNISREGKLNILGIFNIIWGRRFPLTHHSMQLILRLEAHSPESGTKRQLTIRLDDPDGKNLFQMNAAILIPKGRPGEPIVMDHVVAFNQVQFERAGDHAFNILIDNDLKGAIPLKVMQVAPVADESPGGAAGPA